MDWNNSTTGIQKYSGLDEVSPSLGYLDPVSIVIVNDKYTIVKIYLMGIKIFLSVKLIF
jgi:hypothetical protein